MRVQNLDLNDRNQWHSDVTYFFKQSVQGGLIRHGSRKKRVAVLFQRDGQAFEPVHPFRGQVACNSDLVEGRRRVHVQRQYTDRKVLSGSNLSIAWSIVFLGLE